MNTTINTRVSAPRTSTPMSIKAGTTTRTTTDPARETTIRPGQLGGVGGLVFASSVIVQNALRAKFPTNDAGAAEVIRYYANHRSVTLALAVLMPIGLAGLTTFLGAVIARIGRRPGRGAAITGAFGAAGIIATFTILTAFDLAIAGYIHRGAADVSVVDGMWVMHNAVFGLLLAAIGIAVAGLTRASAASGLLSLRWKRFGLVGGTLLLAGATTTPGIIDGSPTMFIGVAGFVVWLAFIIRTSVALMHQPQA
jgi:hypothetical protein